MSKEILGIAVVGLRSKAICRTYGAPELFSCCFPGHAAWAKLWRTSGASDWSGAGEEADEARRGHGCPVPLQRRDAAFGLGAPFLRQDKLKRRPYNYGKARKPVNRGWARLCPYNGEMRPSAWARLSDAPTTTEKRRSR